MPLFAETKAKNYTAIANLEIGHYSPITQKNLTTIMQLKITQMLLFARIKNRGLQTKGVLYGE